MTEEITIFTIKVRIREKFRVEFADWQAKMNAKIAAFTGFVSLEVLSLTEDSRPIWSIVQRFDRTQNLLAWRASKDYHELIEELKNFIEDGPDSLKEEDTGISNLKVGVTEVFVTQISPDKEEAFRAWLAKIHQVESKFPGFKGMYIQSPSMSQGHHWITLLQFDTLQNLDNWLSSPERQAVLLESKPMIASLESHRIISPYAGWFSSLAEKGEIPSVWKQTMIVLLVLFPIVMFELKFLSPLTATFNSSLATFIGNALSVTLISWPMMPIAIRLLGWWLAPRGQKRWQTTWVGTVVVVGLYLLEIVFFWRFL